MEFLWLICTLLLLVILNSDSTMKLQIRGNVGTIRSAAVLAKQRPSEDDEKGGARGGGGRRHSHATATFFFGRR